MSTFGPDKAQECCPCRGWRFNSQACCEEPSHDVAVVCPRCATWRFRATRKDTSEKTARKPVAGHKGGNWEWRQQLGSQGIRTPYRGAGAMAAAGTGTSKTAQPGTADSLTVVPGRDDPAATAGARQRS